MRFVLGLATVLACACVTPVGQPGVVPSVEAEYREIGTLSGMARVYVVRDFTGSREVLAVYSLEVGDDGGTLGRWGWLAFDLAPGDYVLEGRLGGKLDRRPLHLDAGEVVFFEAEQPVSGMNVLQVPSEARALRIIADRPMAWSTNLPAGAMVEHPPETFQHPAPKCRGEGMKRVNC